MGTLYDQPVRNTYSVNENDEIKFIIELSNKYKIPISEIVQILELLEKRRANNLRVADENIKDEQLTGFGELFKELNSNVAELVNHLTNNSD